MLNRRIILNRKPATVTSELITETPVEIEIKPEPEPESKKAVVARTTEDEIEWLTANNPVVAPAKDATTLNAATQWAYAPGADWRQWKLPLRNAAEVRLAVRYFGETDIPNQFKRFAFARIVEAARHFGIIDEVTETAAGYRTTTANKFFKMAGMDIRESIVFCAGCGQAPSFDAHIASRTIECVHCHRKVSFDQFEKEHQP